MKIYLVGGAVRDQLLKRPVTEKDWVVVGATVEEMQKAGFRQVGKDFPVFLHPETKEEYALARTERKVGRGYTGFEFNTSKAVSLEEDLKRRDITINAMAKTKEGEIIDPYHGREDLEKHILRHISPSFAEDPVRILRVARFSARFRFEVAPETLELMRKMVDEGEVNALVPERVWKELERALNEPYPEKFFEVLSRGGALPILFPPLEDVSSCLDALIRASKNGSTPQVRFAALLHHLSLTDVKLLCERYRAPTEYRDLACLVVKYLPYYNRARKLSAEELLNLLMAVDAFRRESRFNDFLAACDATASHPASDWLKAVFNAAKNIDKSDMADMTIGKEIAEKIKAKRLEKIKYFLQQSSQT